MNNNNINNILASVMSEEGLRVPSNQERSAQPFHCARAYVLGTDTAVADDNTIPRNLKTQFCFDGGKTTKNQ
jgi:hypothetical protein